MARDVLAIMLGRSTTEDSQCGNQLGQFELSTDPVAPAQEKRSLVDGCYLLRTNDRIGQTSVGRLVRM